MNRFEDSKTITDDNGGFSLVELIICIAILAIAAVPLYQSMALSIKADSKAQSKQNATSLAESVMEEIKSLSIEELMKRYNGDVVVDGKHVPVIVPLGRNEASFLGASGSETTLAQRLSYASSAAGNVDKVLQYPTPFPTPTPPATPTPTPVPDTPFYVLYRTGAHAAQSTETFDVLATIQASTYKADTDKDDASDANSKKLPRIDEIDPLSQAVISVKELEKYDDTALDYFRQDGDHYDSGRKIVKKDIVIEKKKESLGGNDQVNVSCRVKYSDNTTPNAKTYSRDLFSGTYELTKNNLFLFYNNPTDYTVTITIKDKVDPSIGTHRVNFILQNGGTSNTIKNTTIKVIDSADNQQVLFNANSQLNDDGNIVGSNNKYILATNLSKKFASEESTDYLSGHFYDEEARVRIYDVNVMIIKNGENVTTLHSTKESND